VHFDIGIAGGFIKWVIYFIFFWYKMPSIKIRPIVTKYNKAILGVYNNGGEATFKGTARIIKGHHDELYTLYWEPDGAKTKMDRGGIGKIILASQEPISISPFIMGLKMLAATGHGHILFNEGIWPLGKLGEIRTDKPPENIYIDISITASPPLRRRFNEARFILSQASITDLSFAYIGCKTRKLKPDENGFLE